MVRERGIPKGVMKLPGRDVMGGWSRTEVFVFLVFFPDGPRDVTPPRLRPTRDPPLDDKFSRGGSASPDPPGLRLRAEMPMADTQTSARAQTAVTRLEYDLFRQKFVRTVRNFETLLVRLLPRL